MISLNLIYVYIHTYSCLDLLNFKGNLIYNSRKLFGTQKQKKKRTKI